VYILAVGSGLCRTAVVSGGRWSMETESDSDDDENSALSHSSTQTADAALATSVTSSYHTHDQPTGGR